MQLDGEPLINEKIDKVYSAINSGKRQYFMLIGDQVIDIEQYLTDQGINKVNP